MFPYPSKSQRWDTRWNATLLTIDLEKNKQMCHRERRVTIINNGLIVSHTTFLIGLIDKRERINEHVFWNDQKLRLLCSVSLLSLVLFCPHLCFSLDILRECFASSLVRVGLIVPEKVAADRAQGSININHNEPKRREQKLNFASPRLASPAFISLVTFSAYGDDGERNRKKIFPDTIIRGDNERTFH